MSKDSPSICPVPLEQRPAHEYQQLQEAWLFNWVTLSWSDYFRKLMGVWLGSWLISGPVMAASFPPAKMPLQFILSGAGGAGFFLVLILLRIYLGWSYIQARLQSKIVTYEESGWYDGQSWPKTPEVLTQDQLIATYQVQPLFRRLQHTGYGLAGLYFAGGLIWFFL